jgi:outer membrane protein OmpA-like peptidoglycan-associated protein
MNRTMMIGSVTTLLMLLLASAVAFAGGDDTEVKGMIISRAGETMVVKSADGNKVTVVLTDDTRTKDDKGLFGLDKQELSNTVLIPGLKLRVEGTADDQGRFIAKTITVDGDDLETSEMIQSGLHPTAEQVTANVEAIAANKQGVETNRQAIASNASAIATNQQQLAENIKDTEELTSRFNSLTDYDVKGQAVVKFNVGSADISTKDKDELKRLADTAKGINGYMIEVVGYADSTGSAAMNTQLSERRAKAVATFLMQQGGIPVRRIMAPGAMGEYGPATTNETKTGRAENRRVDVKVLVNKAFAGE